MFHSQVDELESEFGDISQLRGAALRKRLEQAISMSRSLGYRLQESSSDSSSSSSETQAPLRTPVLGQMEAACQADRQRIMAFLEKVRKSENTP